MEQEKTSQSHSKESVTSQQYKTMREDGKSTQSLKDQIVKLEERLEDLESKLKDSKSVDPQAYRPLRYTRQSTYWTV